MEEFETHPRGTGEVLRQLRAEREALTLQVEDQRKLLDHVQQLIKRYNLHMCEGGDCYDPYSADAQIQSAREAITQHLKGKNHG